MLAFLSNLFFPLLAASSGAKGGFAEFWDTYMNYPGFELWKFVNLFVFIGIFIYFVRKPLSAAFKAKREAIRAELIKAEEAKKAALVRLTEIEAKLAGADSEKTRIMKEANAEIEQEKARLVAQAAVEKQKLEAQANGEIVRIGQVARRQLRRFAVEESIRRAEEKLRNQINAETDARLIKSGVQAIGGMN